MQPSWDLAVLLLTQSVALTVQRTEGSERLAPVMERIAEDHCGRYFTHPSGRESPVSQLRCAATCRGGWSWVVPTLTRDGARLPVLADEVHDAPAVVALLDVLQRQRRHFGPA